MRNKRSDLSALNTQIHRSLLMYMLLGQQGRPKDGPEDKFRLTPVVPRLSELLGTNVEKVDDCIGPKVEEAVKKLENGQVGRRSRAHVHPRAHAPAAAPLLQQRCRLFTVRAAGWSWESGGTTRPCGHIRCPAGQ